MAVQTRQISLGPQAGPQEAFLSTPADIAIYGGAAFGGKTWALLYEGLRHLKNPNYGFVLFRRTSPQIRNEGGLWTEAEKMYPVVGGRAKESVLEWEFPSGARGKFSHLEHEKNKYDWQGAQIPYIGFDELTHFTWGQFTYLLSRNRSVCGVRPYIRATCNPDPDSFVARLVEWYLDPESGYPILERSGVVRYFVMDGDELSWGNSRLDLGSRFPHLDPENEIKSFTFIAAKIEDNPIGTQLDPAYRGNLLALPRVDRERLLGGNWKIRPAAGQYFRRSYFEVVGAAPGAVRAARGWDLAGTDVSEGGHPNWTAGVKIIRGRDGLFYVTHVERFQGSPHKVESALLALATGDGAGVTVRLPQDPGQAGKAQVQRLTRLLAGYTVHSRPMSGDKATRAGGLSAQAEAGNIKLVRGSWNETFLDELEAFSGAPGAADDQVDAAVEAFDELSAGGRVAAQKITGV